MDSTVDRRPVRSSSLAFRLPAAIAGNNARHTIMQAPVPNHGTTIPPDKTRNSSPPSHLTLTDSCLRSKGIRCGSPVPSQSTILSTCSDGPLSPRSFQSTVQTSPPGTALTFSHSREASLDAGSPVHNAETLAILMNKTSLHSIPTGKHHRNAASLDVSQLSHHQGAGSQDFPVWQKDLSRSQDFGLPLSFEPLVEDDDEDLRAYRRETQHPVLYDVPSASGGKIADETTSDLAESTQSADSDLNSEDVPRDSAAVMAKCILEEHFGLSMGSSEPPNDVVEAVRLCLDDVSIAIRSIQSMGVMSHTNAAGWDSQTPGSYGGSPFSGSEDRSSSNSRKRPLRDRKGDDDDLHSRRGGSEDVGDPLPQRDGNNPKRTKVESYPCLFRKRDPYRFNCRDWEYCAKAPFKSISELKKHVLKYHQQQDFAYKCIRCHVGFTRVEDLNSHIRVANPLDMCSLRDGPPPDTGNEAISLSVSNRLRNRKDHFDWVTLWRTLFPQDENVPEPDFEPVVELHEVNHEVQTGLLSFQTQLHSTLEALLPSLQKQNTSQLCHILGSTLENLFMEFLSTSFTKARSHAAESSQSHRENTPPPALQSRTRRPSVSTNSTRPSSLASNNEKSNQRPILPNMDPINRLSVWSSTESSDTSPSSSFRYSTSTYGQSQRVSMAESATTWSSLPVRPLSMAKSATNGDGSSMRELVLLENKRQRELNEAGVRALSHEDASCGICSSCLLDIKPCDNPMRKNEGLEFLDIPLPEMPLGDFGLGPGGML